MQRRCARAVGDLRRWSGCGPAGGDPEQFGVGDAGVFGDPLQVVGVQVVGVIDDDQGGAR
ncbi:MULTISPECIES: hypothetical protein [Mycobacterium]|uniref:Uncharacterized protein n=1 Tax=Mycobacterium gordonae TaxID=1778 RepID=A0A1A6BIE4_MYCGO|nr:MULTISPECIES: hypothetical protein [Mycobacterium]PJE03456.1 MAG: hypothetical protein CK429_33105 [Mycobacterium sp.]MCV7007312.1 hypothetical protein [Mycobacterium gordonae]MDP7707045.1 hypothetical protein [Mycobacterium sp. TY815]OBS02071.1 hypothetical protein A9W98_16840 [Mycobacterium gordonae]ODR17709.1 hypothetical protein BHQ23_25425 [Mycobacterium gordonae]